MAEETSEERIKAYHSEVKPFLRQNFDLNAFRAIVERHERTVSPEFSREVLNPNTDPGQLRYLHGKLKLGYQQHD
tara:strand:- start:752 stop:976 length:225 start_codon:yes stop_codon:yes gene_type:complete